MSPLRRVAIVGAATLAGLLILVGTFVAGRRSGDDPPAFPAEGSVDVGFARDMRVHHAQAVELADLLRARTTDEDLRRLARDIALTQQSQIGQMRGWLDTWDRRPTSVDPPMQWMDMGTGSDDPSELMLGLATDEEIAALTAAEGAEAETLFLELMIRHHMGGLHMAQVAAAEAEEPYVRALATGIVESQTADIAAMTDLLAARGVQYGGG